MRHIFNHEAADFDKACKDNQKQVSATQFRHEIMLAFWLAIHMQDLEIANSIKRLDPIIEQVIVNLRNNGKVLLRQKALKHQKLLEKKKTKLGTQRLDG